MALATPVVPELTSSVTRRQFQRALLAALAALGVGCVLYAGEKYGLRPRHRFVENPVDVMMRAFGVAHFLIAWLFLATSPRLRSPAACLRLAACAAVGIGMCLAAAQAGGYRQPLVALGFYAFFLFHETHDQAALFAAYGEAPSASRPAWRFRNALALAAALTLVAVLATIKLVHGWLLGQVSEMADFSSGYLVTGWLGVLLIAALWWAWTARLGRQAFGSFTHALATHGPLLEVYGGMLAVLSIGSLLGSVGFNLVILVHVTSWLVFLPRQLAQRPVAAANLWTWVRHTPAGFVTLHLLVVGGLLVLMALRVYEWGKVGLMSQVLASSSFYYWSVLHIATSLWRR